MVYLPAFQLACSKIISIAWFIWVVWCDDDPFSGRSDDDQELAVRVHDRLAGGGVHWRRGVASSAPARATSHCCCCSTRFRRQRRWPEREPRPSPRERGQVSTSHLISSHFGLTFHAGDGVAAQRATVVSTTPRRMSTRVPRRRPALPDGSRSSRRNGTPRGRRRGGRGLWILERFRRIQSRGLPRRAPSAWAASWQTWADRVGMTIYCPGWLPSPIDGVIHGQWNTARVPDRQWQLGYAWLESGRARPHRLRGLSAGDVPADLRGHAVLRRPRAGDRERRRPATSPGTTTTWRHIPDMSRRSSTPAATCT